MESGRPYAGYSYAEMREEERACWKVLNRADKEKDQLYRAMGSSMLNSKEWLGIKARNNMLSNNLREIQEERLIREREKEQRDAQRERRQAEREQDRARRQDEQRDRAAARAQKQARVNQTHKTKTSQPPKEDVGATAQSSQSTDPISEAINTQLVSWFQRTNVANAPEIDWRFVGTWIHQGYTYMALMDAAGAFQVWVEVPEGTDDSQHIQGRFFLPANNNAEIGRARNAANRVKNT